MGAVESALAVTGVVVVSSCLAATAELIKFIRKVRKPPARPVTFEVPNEKIEKAKEENEEVDMEQLRVIAKKNMMKKAKDEMGIDCVNHFNFAICGESGTGKSSLINALRQMADSDEGAAKVGVIETTQTEKCFYHPKFPHVLIWDLPGAGTIAHPAETYFYDMKLYAFDCILVVTSKRFMEVDLQIIKCSIDNKKPVAIVRTNADTSVQNLVLQSKSQNYTAIHASDELRKIVNENMKSNLNSAGIFEDIPVYIVSNRSFIQSDGYTFYNPQTHALDKTLKIIDEDKIYEFMASAVEDRIKSHDKRVE